MTRAPLSPPAAVLWIARTLEEAGFETWAVGGAVRDVFLGHPSGDWDLTTLARPEQMRRLFRRTVPIGVEHGTVGILARDGTMFEVTTFRRDVETDGRHAVVAFADSVEEDLARRDFTINAIAWHPLRDEILDPYGGVDDLRAGIIRTVGEAAERFAEDYLRVLRALRFAGRFGFRIDEGTWSALLDAAPNIEGLSAERIRDELLKILEADHAPSVSLDLYRSAGALRVIHRPLGTLADDGDVWKGTLAVLDELPPQRPFLRLAALVRPLGSHDAVALLLRLKLSNARVDEVIRLAEGDPMPPGDADDADIRRWLGRVGPEGAAAHARLELARARSGRGSPQAVVASWQGVRRVRATRPPLAVGDLAVDGRDLIRLGLKPGPHFRRILEGLLDLVLAEPHVNRVDVLETEALRLAAALEEGRDDV